MKRFNKCHNCAIHRRIEQSDTPACCVWFMNNVVILGKSVEKCTDYEPLNGGSASRFVKHPNKSTID